MFWYKIFDVEILYLILIIVCVSVNMLYIGCCIVIEWLGKVVEVIFWLINDVFEYLFIGFNYV